MSKIKNKKLRKLRMKKKLRKFKVKNKNKIRYSKLKIEKIHHSLVASS